MPKLSSLGELPPLMHIASLANLPSKSKPNLARAPGRPSACLRELTEGPSDAPSAADDARRNNVVLCSTASTGSLSLAPNTRERYYHGNLLRGRSMARGPWKIIFATALLIALFLSAAWAEDSRWDELLQAGNAALEAKRYEEAEKDFRAALEEASAGDPQDPKLIASLRALVGLYQRQGKIALQEPYLRRILELQQDQLGDAHPDLTPTLLELALLYGQLRRPAWAEPLMRRALEIQESQSGPNDPTTISLVNMLGSVCLDLRKFNEAEGLFHRSLLTHEAADPPDTTAMAHDLQHLSGVYSNQGKNEESEALARQALEIQDNRSQEPSGMAAHLASSLGRFYWGQGRYAEAEVLLLRWLELEERTMGPQDPNVLACLDELVNFYRIQGRETEASALAQRALEMAARAKEQKGEPSDHSDLERVRRLANSGSTFMSQGEYARAEELYREALELEQKSDPREYPMKASLLGMLGYAKCMQGKYEEALPFFGQSNEITAKAVGGDHPEAIQNQLPLAQCLTRTGKYGEAEALLKHLIARLEKPGTPSLPALLNVLERYSRLLHRMNREDEAQRVEARMAKLASQVRSEGSGP